MRSLWQEVPEFSNDLRVFILRVEPSKRCNVWGRSRSVHAVRSFSSSSLVNWSLSRLAALPLSNWTDVSAAAAVVAYWDGLRACEADSAVNCCWQSPTSEGGFHLDTHTTHDVSLQMKFTPHSALCAAPWGCSLCHLP